MATVEQNQVCFRSRHLAEPWTLKTYRSVGGYTALEALLQDKSPWEEKSKRVIETLKLSSLRGRGGAGFPTD